MKLLFFVLTFFSLAFTSYAANAPRQPDPADVKVPKGYKTEVYAIGLSTPTSAIFDGEDLIVTESGFAETNQPRVIRIKPNRQTEVIAEAGLHAPVTGVLKVNNKFYISHKGRVSVVENGQLKDLLTGLPSNGDHQNNKLSLGPDGKIYFGQGTITNSGVVGEDSYYFGWLAKHPKEHDVPCQDITLTGQNFESANPLKPGDQVITGAYLPFGSSSTPGQIIKANPKCNGAILRFNPDDSNLEVVAWGLRNPFGVAFDSEGQLWSTFHGADTRGSRSVANDPDYLVRVEENGWYGWPDFFAGLPVTEEKFHDKTKAKPQFLIQNHPPLKLPYLTFQPHSGTNGLAFAPNEFGFGGQAFIAMFGSFTPVTAGFDVTPAGFRIARVDLENKQIYDFATNILPGPSYITKHSGFDRPSDVVFGSDKALYIVDYGSGTIDTEGVKFVPHTGSIWRIYPETMSAKMPGGPIEVSLAPASETDRKPLASFSGSLFKDLGAQILFFIALIVAIISSIIWLNRKK
jgi:glucose/arabinose dehydrogenase